MDPELRKLCLQTFSCRNCRDLKVPAPSFEIDEERGIVPAYPFVVPVETKLDKVDFVILGQNPGNTGYSHRLIHKLMRGDPPNVAFDRLQQVEEWDKDGRPVWLQDGRYWSRCVQMLDLLWQVEPQSKPYSFIGLEVAYCHTADGKAADFEDLKRCAKKHLVDQFKKLNKGAVVICIGTGPYNVFRSLLLEGKIADCRPWCWVNHLSGNWGAFRKLVDSLPTEGKQKRFRLKETVKENWKDVLSRKERGIDLGSERGKEHPTAS